MARFALLIAALAGVAVALPEQLPRYKSVVGQPRRSKVHRPTKAFSQLRGMAPSQKKLRSEYTCEGCVSMMNDGISALINAIVSTLPSTCADLCQAAFPHSQTEGEICDGICTVAGLYEFMNIIDTEDISPVWACLEVDACPATTCKGDCINITRVTSNPMSVAPPNAFTWNYVVTFAEGVGTTTTFGGMQQIGGNGSWGCDQGVIFYEPQANVPYPVSLTSTLETAGGNGIPAFCPSPGSYHVDLEVCKGQCGDTFASSGPVIGRGTLSQPVKVLPTSDKCEQP
eukprot:TRINITY_DN2321_c0_g1_i1.p1 TRINITY_DN2321_c0_g1~~TRINITY_DN2321_c0_g1_i1.p1  ORF type:complete len:285 (-),score=59.88 TRINITY_DN2321_c0_g1_i1:240-1094(-)